MGAFLDPVEGVWALERSATAPHDAHGTISGLHGTVNVRYDHRGVPHIFATTEVDAYRALGYVVARDRLFQMELQARAAAGTLTELVGSQALARDQDMRHLGLPRAAERQWAAMDTASDEARMERAYADGVNAWIDAMPASALPLEYRLLGKKPTRWAPINTLHLLNYMSLVLASNDEEITRARAAVLIGRAAAEALSPIHAPIQDPIVPAGKHAFFVDEKIPPAGSPDTSREARLASQVSDRAVDSALALTDGGPDGGTVNGSNNWAVSPKRSASHHALLAGDPHLDMSLPSLWYQAHLVVPGVLDVQGVTIPGAPSIIIGFNRDIAWTFTNVEADVLDHFAETVDDSLRPTRYRLDGTWRPLEMRVEEYRDPHGRVIATDTVRYTHRGPMSRVDQTWLSMRWAALDPSPSAEAFLEVAHARNVQEFERAMDIYLVPAQNMLVADRAGSIALRSTGHFPVRAGDGSGVEIRDGSTSANDWQGYLPLSAYPQSLNPAQGFLASTNQEPTAPTEKNGRLEDRPYFGNDWPGQWRAIRINQLLQADSAVTPDAMRRMQLDRGSARADYFVPFFLRAAERVDSAGERSASLADATRRLAAWDRTYRLDDSVGGAALFEAAMDQLANRLWVRLSPETGAPRVATPTAITLVALMRDPTNPWWGSASGAHHGRTEAQDEMLASSLAGAYDSLARTYGPPTHGAWQWSHVQTANIYHQFHIASLSRTGLPPQGGPHTLSPTAGNGTHGSSWRMIVELGDTVSAWGIYPGGQSGNPLSRYYTDQLTRWEAGQLDTLRTPRRPNDVSAQEMSAALTLDPVP